MPVTFQDFLGVRNTLNLYAIALDQKNFHLLDQVFTPDAEADFTAVGVGKFTDTKSINKAISSFLQPVDTQHALTTQTIDFHETAGSQPTASAVTYVSAQHFGRGEMQNEHFFVYAFYEDELAKVDGQWRITSRRIGVHVSRCDEMRRPQLT